MEKTHNMQKKVLQDFVKRHFKTKRIKFGKNFKRVIMGYDNKIYYIGDELQKAKLKSHLTELLGEIFGFNENVIKKVVNRFI